MPPRIADISIHAEDPAARDRFWCAVMGYPEWTAWPPEDEAALRAAGLDDADLAARAGGLGRRPGPPGPFEEFAIMMRDPEGNEFCLQ